MLLDNAMTVRLVADHVPLTLSAGGAVHRVFCEGRWAAAETADLQAGFGSRRPSRVTTARPTST